MSLFSATFLGSQIVPFPTTPSPRLLTWTSKNIVAANVSTFTAQTQVQIWPGSWWECKVEYAPLTEAQGEIIVAFLTQCYGLANVFQLGDPVRFHPRGSVTGYQTANGVQASGARSLSLSNFTPSAVNVLLPGDYVTPFVDLSPTYGYRAYRCLDTVSADSSGNATFNIFPPIRESIASGTGMSFTNTAATFRLTKNDQQWSVNSVGTLYGVSFECAEAL